MSLLPPPLQTSFSRDLLLADDALTPVGGNLGDDDGAEDVILAHVEEMLEGWDPGSIAEEHGPSGKGTLESQLLDELSALEAVSYASFENLKCSSVRLTDRDTGRPTSTPSLRQMSASLSFWSTSTGQFSNLTRLTPGSPATRFSST